MKAREFRDLSEEELRNKEEEVKDAPDVYGVQSDADRKREEN